MWCEGGATKKQKAACSCFALLGFEGDAGGGVGGGGLFFYLFLLGQQINKMEVRVSLLPLVALMTVVLYPHANGC